MRIASRTAWIVAGAFLAVVIVRLLVPPRLTGEAPERLRSGQPSYASGTASGGRSAPTSLAPGAQDHANAGDEAQPTESDTGFIAGCVLLGDGRPALGAEVTAIGTDAITATSSDGVFLLEVKPGEHRLVAQLGADTGAMGTAVVVARAQTVHGVIIRLTRAASFVGVVSADDGSQVAGAKIVARLAIGAFGAPENRWGRTVASATADANGRFTVAPLARGIYSLEASAAGFTEERHFRLALEAGQRLDVPMKLKRLGTIEGVIKDEAGSPIPGSIITTWDWHGQRLEARSGQDGHYRIEGVRPDRITVAAAHSDALGHIDRPVDVSPGSTVHADFTLPITGQLTGIVRLPSGAPASSARVEFYSKARADIAGDVATDADGYYNARLLPGFYEVTASRGALQKSQRRMVRARASAELNLELAEEPQSAERGITGIVLDAAGQPARGAWVGVRRADSLGTMVFIADRERGSALTGEDGRFEVQPFGRADDEDSVAVVARAGGSFGKVQGLKAGAEVVVQLQKAATVVGHAIGFRGGSYQALVEPHDPSGPTEASSWIRFEGDQFTLTDLAPVPSVLRVRQGDYAAAIELTVEPGQTTEVDVRLAAEAPITGRLVDRATGEPVAETWVMVTGETFSSRVVGGDIELERVASNGSIGLSWTQAGAAEAAIDHVLPGGPAALAGLRGGDVIVAVNGEPVEGAGDASDLIRGPIGTPAAITVRRNGGELTVQVVRGDLDALTAGSHQWML